MISEHAIQERVRERLSNDPARFCHIEGVIHHVTELAEIFHANVQKARISAWCHDATKGMDPQEEVQQINAFFPDLNLADWPQPTRHALTGVIFAKTDCHIEDSDILNAIRYHTTGRPKMGKIEKILFVADFIEESRTFVSKMQRELAKINLDLAVLDSLESTIAYLQSTNQPIAQLTFETRDYYRKNKGGSE